MGKVKSFFQSKVRCLRGHLNNAAKAYLGRRLINTFYILNAILIIGAIVLISVGASYWITLDAMDSMRLTSNIDPRILPMVMVISASYALVFSCCGCWFAATKSSYLLMTYAALMVITAVAQFVLQDAIIDDLGYPDDLDTTLLVNNFKGLIHSSFRQGVAGMEVSSAIQASIRCCGLKKYREWGRILPLSCCYNPMSVAFCKGYFSVVGSCGKRIFPFIEGLVIASSGFLLGYSLVAFVAAMVGFSLACKIMNPKRSGRRHKK